MSIEVITGPVKSNKTFVLIERLLHAKEYGKKEFLAFKPNIDTRDDARNGSEKVFSFNRQMSLPAKKIPADQPELILAEFKKPENGAIGTIALSEAQFFSPSICSLAQELDSQGKRVIVEGLLLDHQGRSFGSMAALWAMADKGDFCYAICECRHPSHLNEICGHHYASFSALKPDVSVKEGQVIILGRDEFLAMCAKCFYQHLEYRYVDPGMRQYFL